MNFCQILKSFCVFGLLLILAAGVVFQWPQLVLNSTTLSWLAHFLNQRGIQLKWKSMELEFDSVGLLHKAVRFNFRNFCIDLPQSQFSGCADLVKARVGVDFSRLKPRVTEITPLVVQNFRWEAGQEPRKIRGVAQVEGAEIRKWTAVLRGDAQFFDHSVLSYRGRIQLETLSLVHPKLNYHLELNYQNKKIIGRVKFQPGKISAQVDGLLDRHRWTGDLKFQVNHLIPGIPQLTAKSCQYQLRRNTTRELWHINTSGSLNVVCPVEIIVPAVPHDDYRKIPRNFFGTLDLKLLSSDFLPRLHTDLSGDARLVLDPIRSSLIEGGGQVTVHLSRGIVGESVDLWKMTSFSGLHFEIPEFQRVVENFRNGPWAIPAPFQVLHGRVFLALEGEADWKTGRFPFRIRTHLHSSTQFLKLKGGGNLLVTDLFKNAEWRLGIDAVLTEVQLELPRLDWARPPKVVPDQRFYSSWPPQRPSQNSRFHYRISIRTPIGHPGWVLSNLTTRKIPVLFEVVLSDSMPLSGMVRMVNFPVEIFRRKAQIESFQITFRDPLTASLVFGSMQTTYADYKITIQLGASLDRPQVHLLSEPALPESQIVSVLLFGRPLEELTSLESSSVGNAQSAIADQALGLASIYALASTPIQSLAYDPRRGVISAKLKLGEGSSLNLGTNAKESAVIEFQQRLGSNWSLQAGVESTDTTRGSASASLQWSRRY